MRRGSFPIEHRRVGNVIVVKLDDYVDWFKTGTSVHVAPAEPQQIFPVVQTESEVIDQEQAKLHPARRETREEFKARIHREVIAEMRRKGFDVK